MPGRTVADHKRKLIRHALVAMLTTEDDDGIFPTDAEDRVFPNRTSALFSSELPAIGVYTFSESVETMNEAPRVYMRRPSIAIEIVAKDNDDLDDVLDDISAQVEYAMLNAGYLPDEDGAETLDGKIDLGGTEQTIVEAAERKVGLSRTTWVLPYTSEAEPIADDDLDNFELADIKHETVVPGAAAEDQAAIYQDPE